MAWPQYINSGKLGHYNAEDRTGMRPWNFFDPDAAAGDSDKAEIYKEEEGSGMFQLWKYM